MTVRESSLSRFLCKLARQAGSTTSGVGGDSELGPQVCVYEDPSAPGLLAPTSYIPMGFLRPVSAVLF